MKNNLWVQVGAGELHILQLLLKGVDFLGTTTMQSTGGCRLDKGSAYKLGASKTTASKEIQLSFSDRGSALVQRGTSEHPLVSGG